MTTKNFKEIQRSAKNIMKLRKSNKEITEELVTKTFNKEIKRLSDIGLSNTIVLNFLSKILANSGYTGIRERRFDSPLFVIDSIMFNVSKCRTTKEEEEVVSLFKEYLPNRFYYDCAINNSAMIIMALGKYGFKVKGASFIEELHPHSYSSMIPVLEITFK